MYWLTLNSGDPLKIIVISQVIISISSSLEIIFFTPILQVKNRLWLCYLALIALLVERESIGIKLIYALCAMVSCFILGGILKYLLSSYNLNHMNAGLSFYLDVKKVSGRPEDKHFVLLVVYLPPHFSKIVLPML